MRQQLSSARQAGFVLAIGILIAASGAPAQAQEITPPEKFFAFQLGSDRKMARWDKIVEYYQLLEKQSGGQMKLIDMGPTTMGHPFLLAIVSSAENIGKLDRLREISTQLADPRGLSEAQAMSLSVNGFVNDLVRQFPMEYSVELKRLIEMEMEGSVG